MQLIFGRDWDRTCETERNWVEEDKGRESAIDDLANPPTRRGGCIVRGGFGSELTRFGLFHRRAEQNLLRR